jgi:hypothetical protein
MLDPDLHHRLAARARLADSSATQNATLIAANTNAMP